jgi:hypothetical protein
MRTLLLVGVFLLIARSSSLSAHAETNARRRGGEAAPADYVGKYPWDKVNGISILEMTRSQFLKFFGAEKWKRLLSYKSSGPAMCPMSEVCAETVFVTQCENHTISLLGHPQLITFRRSDDTLDFFGVRFAKK